MESSFTLDGMNLRASCASTAPVCPKTLNLSGTFDRLPFILLTCVLALLSTTLLNGQVNVLTNRYDNGRTGLNPKETFLNPANVKSSMFAKLGFFNVDGFIVAQPLYMENVSIGGTLHDVVFVATMHDSLYAFDANNLTGAPLWQQSFINPGSGITPVPIGDQGCPLVNGYNEVGIQGTPVIQPAGNGGTLYVDAKTKVTSGSGSVFVHTLYAVDITNGSVLKSTQVTGSVQGANGTVPFDSSKGCQRAGLLLSNGIVYVAFGSNGCDNSRGWVFAYDSSLNQLGEFSTSPNQPRGANIWQGGAGLAADDNGNVFFLTANGPFTVNTGGSDFGDSFMKLTLTGGVLNWSDYFTPFDQANMAANDLDLGSGGAMLLSSPNPNVLIGAGKTGSIYVVDPNNMGGFNANDNSQIIQWLQAVLFEVDGTPAYWNNAVYFAPAHGPASWYSLFSNGHLSTLPMRQTVPIVPIAGPTLSSNGASNGIMWLVRNAGSPGIQQLAAYDGVTMSEIYNSTVAGARDTLGTTPHFVIPTVADGRVYVGTQTQLVVYGLMPVISTVSGGNQTGKAGSTLPLPLTIKVTDPYTGNPLAGVQVTFTAKGGGSFGNRTPTTDSTGTASTTYTLPTTFSTPTLTVTVSSPGYTSTTFTETVTAGSPASIVTVSGGSQTGTVGTTLPKPLVFKVADQFGNGVPNVSVNFSDSPNHGGLSPNPVMTDSLGKATVTYKLPTKAGFNTITASGGGFNASMQERALAGNPASLTIVGGNNQTAPPNTQLPQPLKVRVNDQFMNVVAGVTVNFTDNGAHGSFDNGSAITNSSGVAAVTYTTPNQTGTVHINATVTGLSPVIFTEKVQ